MNKTKRLHREAFKQAARGGVRELPAAEGHRVGGQSGTFRAAVFGINDGLVSNLSLIMGMAGAGPDSKYIVLAGIAGLLAGAFSMGTGEYNSMSAQRELFQRQIDIERREIAEDPASEQKELELIYRSKGMSKEVAAMVATKLMADPKVALDTHSREELGLDPEKLGSPFGAALSSFGAFVMGAGVPVAPYLFLDSSTAFAASMSLSGLALFGIGVAISTLTGHSLWLGGARMLFIGTLAAGITYGVGRVVGISAGL